MVFVQQSTSTSNSTKSRRPRICLTGYYLYFLNTCHSKHVPGCGTFSCWKETHSCTVLPSQSLQSLRHGCSSQTNGNYWSFSSMYPYSLDHWTQLNVLFPPSQRWKQSSFGSSSKRWPFTGRREIWNLRCRRGNFVGTNRRDGRMVEGKHMDTIDTAWITRLVN